MYLLTSLISILLLFSGLSAADHNYDQEILKLKAGRSYQPGDPVQDARSIRSVREFNHFPTRDSIIGETFYAGNTYYDNQSNGCVGKMIAFDNRGNIHVTWTDGYDTDQEEGERHQKYNFFSSEDETWIAEDGTPVDDGERGGYGSIWLTNEEFPRAVVFAHHVADQGLTAFAALDFAYAVGAFILYPLPRYPEQEAIWAQGVISLDNKVHCVYNRRDAEMLSYAPGIHNDDEIGFGENPNQIERSHQNSYRIARSPVSERAAIVWTRPILGFNNLETWEGYLAWQMNNDLMVATTEDGDNWDFDNPFNVTRCIAPNPQLEGVASYGDTLRPFQTFDIIFDENDFMHIVFDARLLKVQAIPESEPPIDGLSLAESMLYHWSEETDEITPVADGWFSHDIYENGQLQRQINPGYWHESNVCYPSLGYDDNGDLYCVYNYFPPDDYSVANYCNGDIAVTVSEDNGATWYMPTMITETHTLEADEGESMCETFPTLNERVDDYLHLSYLLDTEPGKVLVNYPNREEVTTLCDFYYHRVAVAEIERAEIFEGPPWHVEFHAAITNVQRDPGAPIPDEPVIVSAEITHLGGGELIETVLEVMVGGADGEIQEIEMAAIGDNVFTAEIPEQQEETIVWYRIRVVDDDELEVLRPANYWYNYTVRAEGDLQISDIQFPGSLEWGVDYSPYVGYEVTVSGVVTTPPDFVWEYGAFAIQQAPDHWSGVFVRGVNPDLETGTLVEVTGIVRERDPEDPVKWKYLTYIEVEDDNDIAIIEENVDYAVRYIGNIGVLSSMQQQAEHLEGVLVQVHNVLVDSLEQLDSLLQLNYIPLIDNRENKTLMTTYGIPADIAEFMGINELEQGDEIEYITGVFTENQRYAIALLDFSSFDPYSVNDDAAAIPQSVSLEPAFPNPFNGRTKISFSLARSGYVHLAMFDLNGREIMNLAEGGLNAGRHELDIDASELSSGLYMLKLSTGDVSFSQKLILIK